MRLKWLWAIWLASAVTGCGQGHLVFNVDVLSFLSMIRGTGKLVLLHERMERSIYWKDGEIVFASSNSAEHSLGMFLLRNGKITSQQYEESKRRVTAQMRHGKILVQMGAISPKDLWWGVKHQVLDILYSLFSWKDGSFTFLDSADELASCLQQFNRATDGTLVAPAEYLQLTATRAAPA